MFLTRLALMFAVAAAPVSAHEFWIEPEAYQVAPGDAIHADFKNGERFAGNTLSFFERSSLRLDWAFDGGQTPIAARSGDRPAVQLEAPDRAGLLVVVHDKAASTLTYRDWEKFAKFAAHKDFPNVEADHTAAGWPRTGFKERYSRHAKALIAVGHGQGQDRAYGLATEFVARTNPYAPGFDGTMQVELRYLDAPRADAQVEVFDRAPDGTVSVSLHRTDDNGIATVRVTPGHSYLFDAVVLRPAPDAGSTPEAPVWETLWAALTFTVPE